MPAPLGTARVAARRRRVAPLASITAYLPEARDGWDWYVELARALDRGPLRRCGRAGRRARRPHGPSPRLRSRRRPRCSRRRARRPANDTVAGWRPRRRATISMSALSVDRRRGRRASAASGAIDPRGARASSPSARRRRSRSTAISTSDSSSGGVTGSRSRTSTGIRSGAGTLEGPPAKDVASLVQSLDHVGRIVERRRGVSRGRRGSADASEPACGRIADELARLDASSLFDEELLRPLRVAQELHEFVYAATLPAAMAVRPRPSARGAPERARVKRLARGARASGRRAGPVAPLPGALRDRGDRGRARRERHTAARLALLGRRRARPGRAPRLRRRRTCAPHERRPTGTAPRDGRPRRGHGRRASRPRLRPSRRVRGGDRRGRGGARRIAPGRARMGWRARRTRHRGLRAGRARRERLPGSAPGRAARPRGRRRRPHRGGRQTGTDALAMCLVAAFLVHWQFATLFAGLLVVLTLAASLRRSRAGGDPSWTRHPAGSPPPSGPAPVSGSSLLVGAPGTPRLPTEFARGLSGDRGQAPLYRLPATVLAAGAGVASLLAPGNAPVRRRAGWLLGAWALLPAGAALLYAAGSAVPVQRTLSFALAIPLLGGLGAIAAVRWLRAGPEPSPGSSRPCSWSRRCSRPCPSVGMSGAPAGRGATAVGWRRCTRCRGTSPGASSPAVIVVDSAAADIRSTAEFGTIPVLRRVRAELPAAQALRTTVYLGDPDLLAVGRPTLRPDVPGFDDLSREIWSAVRPLLDQDPAVVILRSHFAGFGRGAATSTPAGPRTVGWRWSRVRPRPPRRRRRPHGPPRRRSLRGGRRRSQ